MTAPYSFGGGDGQSEATAFVISQPDHLHELSRCVAEGHTFRGAYFRITEDLDMGGVQWRPIGSFISPFEKSEFSGSIDGCGHTVHNFAIVSEQGMSAGLFGYTDGAALRGIKVGSFRISGDGTIGGVIGFASSTRVDDCHAGGEIVHSSPGGTNVGGLVGSAARCVIERCSAGCEITASGCRGVGGIAGYIYNSTIVAATKAVRKIFASSVRDAGGLFGTARDSEISRCTADVELSGVNDVNTGGLAGSILQCRVSGCTSRGSVSLQGELAVFSVGGFAGHIRSNVRECAVCGDVVSHSGGGSVGGFCGSALEGEIEQCSASGAVDAQGRVGGFVGWLNCEEGGRVRICDCCASGDVRVRGRESDSIAGEFAGRIDRDGGSVVISHSYGFGAMYGTNGGFLGSNVYGTIINCFWRRDDGVNAGKGGASAIPCLTTDDFGSSEKFEAAGWDFYGDEPVWVMTGAVVPPRPYPAMAPTIRKKDKGADR